MATCIDEPVFTKSNAFSQAFIIEIESIFSCVCAVHQQYLQAYNFNTECRHYSTLGVLWVFKILTKYVSPR